MEGTNGNGSKKSDINQAYLNLKREVKQSKKPLSLCMKPILFFSFGMLSLLPIRRDDGDGVQERERSQLSNMSSFMI